MNEKKIRLEVAEALQGDVGRSIARLPQHQMKQLGLVSGDIVQIKGQHKAAAIAYRAYPEDEHENTVRMDGTTRHNTGASLGDTVEIVPLPAQEAQAITLSPTESVQFSGDPTEYFHDRILEKPFLQNQKIIIDVMGTHLTYVVSQTKPSGCVIITPKTKVVISSRVAKQKEHHIPTISYEDIGGLKEEIETVREMIELPMKHPEVFQKMGIHAPKGVLLTGPPGTGKTLLARAVASETESAFYSIAGPEIMSKYYGESEKQLRDIFEEAGKQEHAIIFIDEIDSIAPKRGEGRDQTEKRVVAQLLTSMDGLKSRGNIVVMAATNRPEDIDEALRRPGRFDREIRILPPNEEGRFEILQIHTRGMPLAPDVDLKKLANKTIGYTGADLEALCKEAALKALKPHTSKFKKYENAIPAEILSKLTIHMNHFEDAAKLLEPSAMREVLINKPRTRWKDIGGLEKAKQTLQEAVELPFKNPELFQKAGIRPPKGIILYGLPGTGKTLLAKAVANEANANFISVKGPELISKWVGEGEAKIRELFKRARMVSPTVIFFDEFDSMTKVRGHTLTDATERMTNQLLTELDGIEELENVVVIAATNRLDLIDDALLRPGRIDLKIEIPIPNEKEREAIFDIHTKEMPLEKGFDLQHWVKKTNGWTGAGIQGLCREAGMEAIREAVKGKKKDILIHRKHFENAYQAMKKEDQQLDNLALKADGEQIQPFTNINRSHATNRA